MKEPLFLKKVKVVFCLLSLVLFALGKASFVYSSPHSLEKQYHQVQALKSEKKIDEAIFILKKLTQLKPNNIDWKVELCHLYRWNSSFSESEKCFDFVLSKKNNYFDAWLGKAYLAQAQGNITQAKFFINHVLKYQPHNLEAQNLLKQMDETEKATHSASIDKSSSKHWRIDIGGGAQQFNFSSAARSHFLQVFYQQPKKYFLIGRYEFLDKFGDKTNTGTVGGGYYVHPKIILSDLFSFAPVDVVVPQFQNIFEVTGILPHDFTFSLRHTYRFYEVSQLHSLTPTLTWYFSKWGIWDLSYALSMTQFQNQSSIELDHSFSTRLTFIPLEDRFKFFISYACTEESFDAGNVRQFGKFHAHHIGGGFEWIMVHDLGLHFDTDYENRDNGQTMQVYNANLFYQF